MNQTRNKIFSKPFLLTLFFRQNNYHKHGVFMHTIKVFYHVLRHKEYKFVAASLLHDIGKPFVAYQKDDDKKTNEWSFTDHEEMSYLIIKDWKFISDYTKEIVRYHYLIRDMKKHKTKDPKRYRDKKKIWESLSESIKEDLSRFIKYDDMAKR